jgi:putative ABC transport system permease protein
VAATAEALPLLGARTILGRLFTRSEDRPDASRVVVLGHDLWQRAFGGDRTILGRAIHLDGQPFEVIGVLAPGFHVDRAVLAAGYHPDRAELADVHFDRAELYVPVAPNLPFLDQRGAHNLRTVARLRRGVTIEAAQLEASAVAAAIAKANPGESVGRGMRLEPLAETIVGPLARELWILAGAVSVLLLITCANVAGLWLVRTRARQREIAVRTAIGATRRHLLALLAIEALVLLAVASLAAVGVAQVGLRALVVLRAEQLPPGFAPALDWQALGFAVGCALVTALLFGVAPLAGRRLAEGSAALGKPAASAGMRPGARGALVVAEVALAMVLVSGTALLVRSVWQLLRVEPGFAAERVVNFGIQLPAGRYPMPGPDQYPRWPEVVAAYEQLEARVGALPGVDRVALALDHPLEQGWSTQAEIAGRPQPPGHHEEVRVRPVTPGYHEMLRVPLLAGRRLTAADRAGAAPVTLVNAALVRRYFPTGDPLDAAVSFWGRDLRIVGVVGDERFRGLDRDSEPAIYPSLAQLPFATFRILVRSGLPPATLEREVRAAVAEIEPDVALDDVRPLAALLADSYGQRRFLLQLLASFGALALLLAAVGIYGLIAYQVTQRRRELGIHQALGAGRVDLVALAVGEGARLAALGVLLGLLGSMALAPVLASQLFQVRPLDPASLLLAALVLTATTLAAAWLPASRAAGSDPMLALREE